MGRVKQVQQQNMNYARGPARRKAKPSLTFAHRTSDSRTFLAARSLKYYKKMNHILESCPKA